MTDLLARPRQRGGRTEPEYTRPPVVGALLAAGWAALAGSLGCGALAVIGWLGAEGGTASAAVRVGLDAWLLAHGTPVHVGAATVSMAPLGLTLLPVLLLHHAGRWVARTCAVRLARDAVLATGVLALGYGAFAAVVSGLARLDDIAPDPLRAPIHAGVIAGVAAGLGVLRGSGHLRRGWRKLPEEAQASTLGGAAGLAALLALGAVLLAVALVVRLPRAVELAAVLGPGVVGGVLLALVGIAYVPNAVVAASAFVLGPGFALGRDTVVSPVQIQLGPLPSFPLLAAIPPELPLWTPVLLGAPLLAGAVAGVVAVRRRPVFGMDAAALRGGLAGAVAGLLFAVLAAGSGGAIGPGRLEVAGPTAWQVGSVAVIALGIAGAGAALGVRLWHQRTPPSTAAATTGSGDSLVAAAGAPTDLRTDSSTGPSAGAEPPATVSAPDTGRSDASDPKAGRQRPDTPGVSDP